MNTKTESYYQLTFTNELQRKIYYHLCECKDQTADEVAKSLNLKPRTVTARLNELRNMCLIYVSDIKYNPETERRNQAYSSETDINRLRLKIDKSLEHALKQLEQFTGDLNRVVSVLTQELIKREINVLKMRIQSLNSLLNELCSDVTQSKKLCGCNMPLIRTSDKGGEYCGICEKDLN